MRVNIHVCKLSEFSLGFNSETSMWVVKYKEIIKISLCGNPRLDFLGSLRKHNAKALFHD
jgi:hypothetical protein